MADIRRHRSATERGPLAFLEHGAAQSYGTDHPSYTGGRGREDVSLFMVPNPVAAEKWQRVYPEAQVEVVGSPHVSELPLRGHALGPTVCISFHNELPIEADYPPEMRNAFSHYKAALPNLAGQPFNVIGHAHPRFLAHARRAFRRAGIPLVDDFNEVCLRADLYICDNSSTIFEFAATGRPVLLLNAPWYRRDKEHGLRFWSEADVGMQVDQPEDLPSVIEAALEDPPAQREARFAAVRRVYPTMSVPPSEADIQPAVTALLLWSSAVLA